MSNFSSTSTMVDSINSRNEFNDKIFFVAIVRNEEILVKYSQFAGMLIYL